MRRHLALRLPDRGVNRGKDVSYPAEEEEPENPRQNEIPEGREHTTLNELPEPRDEAAITFPVEPGTVIDFQVT